MAQPPDDQKGVMMAFQFKIRYKPMDRAWSVLMKAPGQRERQLIVVRTRPEADLCLATVTNAFEKFPVVGTAPRLLDALKDMTVLAEAQEKPTFARLRRVDTLVAEAEGRNV